MRKLILILLFILLCVPSSLAYTAYPWCHDVDVFFWNQSSDLSGYRVMDQIPQLDSMRTITSAPITVSSGEVTLGTWITPSGSPGTTTLAPGMWRYRTYARSSSDSGTTTIKFRTFNRSSDGTITWLFFGNAFSEDITTEVGKEYLLSYARRNYTTFFPGDRLGIQVNVSTDSASARTVSIEVAGNTNASMVSVAYFLCPQSSGVGGAGRATQAPISPIVPIVAILSIFAFVASRKQ